MGQAIDSIILTVASNVGTVAILGYFVKRWINGTGADIKYLKESKVEKDLWQAENIHLAQRVSENKCELEKIGEKLSEIKGHVALIPHLREFQMELKSALRENENIFRGKGGAE